MKDKYLVGETINLVSLRIAGKPDININFKNKMFQNTFLNDPSSNDYLLTNHRLLTSIQKVHITDVGHFPVNTTQYFATIIESDDDDLIGSFAQGLFHTDVDFNKLNHFIWMIAHPMTRQHEYIEYNTLKYILSVKATSNIAKGQLLIDEIDTYLKFK